MDFSIRAATPESMRERGAQAFDAGLSIDDHNMNPWVPAVADWQQGWRDRRATLHARDLIKFAAGVGTPP
ncbi:hypothetical protein SAMN05428966_10276 [Massilia sp. PDC64]|nr:hypothetical protein [Massilia sp. PDC64]SDC66860.1 hypothetical protein SAMN05428966_10276 [Massilia sp. PDC64]